MKKHHSILKNKNASAGFTLLEVMLSIALLSTIVMLTINILSNELRLQQKITDRYPFDKIMNRITTDLEGAYLLPAIPQDQKFNFVHSENGQNSQLIFSVINNKSLIYNSHSNNLAQIAYLVEEKENKKQLIRIVDAKMDSNKNLPTPGVGVRTVLAEDIKKFELKFWKKKEFQDKWDSTQNESGKLPKMVKVILSLYVPQKNSKAPKQEIKLDTITYLNNSTRKKPQEKQSDQTDEKQNPSQPNQKRQLPSSPDQFFSEENENRRSSKSSLSEEYDWQ